MVMLDFFHYGFMVRALLAGMCIGIIAPMVGIFLVTRRYSFMADTLAHVSLAGVAGALLIGMNPLLAALGCSTITAIVVEHMRSRGTAKGEVGLSLFLSGGLALASVLMSLGRSQGGAISGVLFGSITTVTHTDTLVIGILSCLIVAAVVVHYRQLFCTSLDEELAIVSGLPVRRLNMTLVILTAIIVSLAMNIVGVLLIGALMVIPVLAAMQRRRSFLSTLLHAIVFSLSSVIVGLFISFSFGSASGGSIVLVAIVIFVACALSSRGRRH